MNVVVATGNAHKLAEIARALPADWHVRPQSDFPVDSAVESGLTFVENAIIKARNAARATGLAAIADDSGLEVDALGGRPGIRSARYAGEDATDADNNRKLLAALEGVPDAERTARFQCVIVLLRHAEDPTPIITTGTWEGRILTSPRGDSGFGYDPLFFVDSIGATAAEMDPATKDALSHRGQAIDRLKERLGA